MGAEERAHRRAVVQVLAVLTDVDPYGLEPGVPEGVPAGEYEPEAADIVRILFRDGAATAHDVEGVWVRWFSESLVLRLGVERTARLVDRLNDVASSLR